MCAAASVSCRQVTLIDGCDALGLTTAGGGERVTGVRILRRADGSAQETLASDLVVAATGRAARVPAWLEALGYPRPEEERLDIGVTYASRRLSLPADPLEGDKFVLIGARPGHPRTLFLFAQEGGRWILGLGGYGPGHRPPSDPEASPRLPPPSLRPTSSTRSRPPSRSTRSRRTASRPAFAAATTACAGSRPGCWSWATRSARSTRPTGRA